MLNADLDKFFKKKIAKSLCSTVNTPKSILNTVNDTVNNNVLPETGRKSKKNITFSNKLDYDDSSDRTLFTFKEDSVVTPVKAESR